MAQTRPDAPRNEHKTFIPEAVRRASEEADRIHKDVYPDDPPPEDPNKAPEKPAEPTHPQPAPQEAQSQEPAPQPSQEPAKGEPDYKRMFEGEQGRNRKLREDISNLSNEITQLRQLISTMRNAEAAKPTPQGNAPEIDVKTLLSAEEQQEWGEVLPVIEKVARGMVAPLQQQLQDRINSVDAKVTTVREHASVSDRQRMISSLDDPNNPINKTNRQWGEHGGSTWRDINTDEEFVSWLQYPDPLSGQKRHDMLKQAFDANDASRVAAFFANFLREVAAVAPPTAQPVPQTNGSAAPGLEQFAAPGRGRTGAPPASTPEAEIITTGDISHFFATKTAGKWKGREAEADTFERKIFASQNAQQVRAGPLQHPELVRIR
jgi:hypothetical protein